MPHNDTYQRAYIVHDGNARHIYRLLAFGAAAARRNGHPLSTQQQTALKAIGDIALAGRTDANTPPPQQESIPAPITDPATTAEVAQLLGVCERNARRYARTLDARVIGGRLVWDRTKVIDYLEGKKHG